MTISHELLHTAISNVTDLTRFFNRRVSDATDAEDLLQELFLAVLQMPCSKAICHPKAYLFTVAANLTHQHWQRSKKYQQHVPLDDVHPEDFDGVQFEPEANAPEFSAELAQRLLELGQRLGELPPRVQAAVIWHHRDGYTCDEIGEKLSVVRHRVKKYLVRGLTHCRGMSAAPDQT